MIVGRSSLRGSIGGGALEWEALRIARDMLASGEARAERSFPLGPDLGQCCGGSVTLEFNAEFQEVTVGAPPLWIWGAGHVGRAIAGAIAPFETWPVVLVDDAAERMPEGLPDGVDPLVAQEMATAVQHAPKDAMHLVLTYSHAIDLALCDALLRHGFSGCGLIGSATKWARFRKRLQQMGHGDAEIDRILCPIGDPSLGKHPQAIAIGVAAGLASGTGLGVPRGDKSA